MFADDTKKRRETFYYYNEKGQLEKWVKKNYLNIAKSPDFINSKVFISKYNGCFDIFW